MFLDFLKSHKGARLALQMVEQCCQCGKFFSTGISAIRAMIHVLLVNWRVKVTIQGAGIGEAAVADIAFPGVTVERTIRSRIFSRIFVLPLDLLDCNDA